MDGSSDPLPSLCPKDTEASAEALQAMALRIPRLRGRTLVDVGIAALKAGQPQSAFLAFAEAAQRLPQEASLPALMARAAMDQQRPDLALRILDRAWQRHPGNASIRAIQWTARFASQPAEQTLRQAQAAWSYMSTDERGYVSSQLQRAKLPLPQAAAQAPHIETTASVEPESYFHTGRPLTAGVATQRPIDHMRARVAAVSAKRKGSKHAATPASTARIVDVLVPVYGGADEVAACLNTVLRHAKANRTPHRVIVLDDASPDPGLANALRRLAREGHIDLVRQPVNLGFIRNVNYGMRINPSHDVVWLNADTRVHGNWLDRLRAAAYAKRDTATATPFSNNGELLSFPNMLESAAMPNEAELAELDQLASKLPAKPVEIEVGCGFCFFIKRVALEAVGLLDEVELERGYGEETDWCLRARHEGWAHVAATNVFVAHRGGVSFGDEKPLRVQHNNAILRRRYPDAEARFNAFVEADPLGQSRQALQRARLKGVAGRLRLDPSFQRCLTLVDPRTKLFQLPDDNTALTLTWSYGGHAGMTASLQVPTSGLSMVLEYRLPSDAQRLDQDLRHLPIQTVSHDQLSQAPAGLQQIVDRLRLQDQPIHQPQSLPSGSALSEGAILITDVPGRADLADRWLTCAREWSTRKTTKLLLPVKSAWWPLLAATGGAAALPVVEGLTLAGALTLSGCCAALSLDDDPSLAWLAPSLARQAAVPLHAPPSGRAWSLGAHAVDALMALKHTPVAA